MNDIPRGWAVIPKNAWYVAVGVALAMALLLQLVPLSLRPDLKETPQLAFVLFGIVLPAVVGISIVLYGWIYGDAKRRGMRAVLWLLLSIFIPNLIGVILYFVLRDPLPVSCPKCSTPVAQSFAYCPSCGTQVVSGCTQCGKAVEPGWKNCAHCGAKL